MSISQKSMTYLLIIHFKNKKIHEMQKKIHEVDFFRSEMRNCGNLGTVMTIFRVRSAAGGGWVVFPAVIPQVSRSEENRHGVREV